MIIDCISDLHGYYPKLEGGDLLIVAGDLTSDDSAEAWCKFETWITDLNYHIKIVIGGNHDNFLQSAPAHNMWKYWDKVDTRLHYLCDSGTEFEGLKIWGSPWTKTFPGMNPRCKAFTVDTEEELAEKWALIPDDVDILVTHSPLLAVLDVTAGGKSEGSLSLCAKVGGLRSLKLHVFGHIHEGYGQVVAEKGYRPAFFDISRHESVNASHVNECYEPVNKPIRIEL